MDSTMDCTLIEALAAVRRQREDEAARADREAAEAKAQRRIDYARQMRERVDALVPAEWLAELGEMTAVWVGDTDYPVLHFEFDGVPYRIRWLGDSWIELRSGYGNQQVYGLVGDRDGFLPALAEIHEDARALAEARAEAQAAEEAALAMHQRCVARIQSCTALAKRTTWRWPAGAAVRIWRWSWCTAPATGEADATWDSGYSVSDETEDGGYLILLPERCRSRVRTIRPAPLSMPTVELITATCMAELPEALREPVRMTLHGVGYGPAARWDDEPRYVEDADGRIAIDSGDEIPLRWVRDLVDGHPYV